MNKKTVAVFTTILLLLVVSLAIPSFFNKSKELETDKLQATVLEVTDDELMVRDSTHRIYTFNVNDISVSAGDDIIIEYTGVFDNAKSTQEVDVVDYQVVTVAVDEDGIPNTWQDNGIFSDYYVLAYNKLQELSLEEKIGQLLLVRYPDTNASEILQKYKLSGFVFYEKDFKDKTEQEVQNMINDLQTTSSIPLLTAVDEEGGTVVRVSSNPNLVSSQFKSSQELYALGGFDTIRSDTINKSTILYNLGLNLNLAPVVDVSTDPTSYMYARTLGQNTNLTSIYAKTVIEASKLGKVSYTLKHFPGYGNNADTHTGSSIDTRTYDYILNNDLPPFEAGISAGAEAVLISHNIVNAIDADNPASLSPSVHNLLRDKLDFTGIIITDDLAMSAVSTISNVAVKAILAGNDLVITTDYETSFNSIKNAVEEGKISEDLIDKLAFRVLAWKYYKGLMLDLK